MNSPHALFPFSVGRNSLRRENTHPVRLLTLSSIFAILLGPAFAANLSGGGTGKGPDVTVTDNGDGTATVANGVVSINIVKETARMNSITYAHGGASSRTDEMLKGKGQFWWGGFAPGSKIFSYSLATDPQTNGGDYAEVKVLSTSENHGTMEVRYSMLRGSPGFYSTAILSHRAQDEAFEIGAWGFLARVPNSFQWSTVDARRNFFLGDPGSNRLARVPNSPHEIGVLLDGASQGEFDDKFIFSLDNADRKAWGWSSVGKGGLNVGAWLMTRQLEFSTGGPLKRDVANSHDHGINNPILTGEVGMGSDGYFEKGEVWTKTCGPCLYYFNQVPASVTDPKQASQMLYHDAVAQSEAETAAWPYPWFKHADYAPTAGRGTVTGKFAIDDAGDPHASPANLWVGLEQQPRTITGTYDFQKWFKAYQFWVQTDAQGNFTIPHVLPGDNYTLWAYGPGATGTFQSQNLTGGNPPLEFALPAKPFAVQVKAGGTNHLGTVTWTPKRVGATVFQLGYPDRKSGEFRHGEDFWAPAKAPKLGFPTPVWGGQMEYPLDFPKGLTFVVGHSRWATDWNYVLPSSPDAAGVYQPCTATIQFALAKIPTAGAKASIYLGCAGFDKGPLVISINGTPLDRAPDLTAGPTPISAAGFVPPYKDDSSSHFSDHGPFSDERFTFSASLLHAGENTLTIQVGGKDSSFLMVDYLRLELTGYVPPAPMGVAVAAGNGRTLLSWRAVPGATSYDVLRATAPDTEYKPLATDVVGVVCGDGDSMVSYLDSSANNDKIYQYVVRSVNPTGRSAFSPPSGSANPVSALSAVPPPAPESLAVTGASHHRVALVWSPSPGASFYRVHRTTLHPDGVGGMYPLRTPLLETVVRPMFVDETPTDGRTYGYEIEAVGAAGASPRSAMVTAVPLPPRPTIAPDQLSGKWTKTRNGSAIVLSWAPVPGATGYVIYRSTNTPASFKWPENFLTVLVETTYQDQGNREKTAKVKGLNPQTNYTYQVTAVNAGSISPPATVNVTAQ